MSSRLIELLLRMFGRVRGGLGLITITATAFFSGVSGSKLADIAAVGGIVMPAVRQHAGRTRTRRPACSPASAVMAETIPPCVNMIIMGFVANLSIAGLFIAGLVPAAVMARVARRPGGDRRAARSIRPRPSRNRRPLLRAARRRAGGRRDDRHDRQGRDLGRRDVDRSVGVRRDLCAGRRAGWRFANSASKWHRAAVRDVRRRWRAASCSSSRRPPACRSR